ncbi:MAG: hypothetical protein ACTHK4_11480, partial [Mycobacteriales bacterium]
RRPVNEMLRITNATCNGLTLQGTGVVTVKVPNHCPHARKQVRVVTANLGPSMPTNQSAGEDALPVYGRTIHIDLKAKPREARERISRGAT